MTTPARIWIWPDQDAYGVQNWGKGCYRAEPRRPLDDKDGPTGAEYVPAEIMADLYAALERAREHIAGSAPDWHYRTQDELAAIDVSLAKARGEA